MKSENFSFSRHKVTKLKPKEEPSIYGAVSEAFKNVLETTRAFSRYDDKTAEVKRLFLNPIGGGFFVLKDICSKRKKLAGKREIKIAIAMYVAETWIFLSE